MPATFPVASPTWLVTKGRPIVDSSIVDVRSAAPLDKHHRASRFRRRTPVPSAPRDVQPTAAPPRPPGWDRHSSSCLLLRVDQIRPNPDNPRRDFDPRGLEDLARSIKTWGQLQPVVVRRDANASGLYQLICGERRWRAHQYAGLTEIWAIERDASDADLLRLALIENLHRVGLARAEKMAALDQLAEMTQAVGLRKIAGELRIDPSWLSRQLTVRKDPRVCAALESGQLGFGQAAELWRAPEPVRHELLARVLDNPGHVGAMTIRAWVEQARAQAREDGQLAAAPASSVFRSLLKHLERLGPPRSDSDRTALTNLLVRVRQLLEPEHPGDDARPSRAPTEWLELECLMCGEKAAVIVNGVIHSQAPESTRRDGRRLVCGRCGGALINGQRGVSYSATGMAQL
jgi:ParB/RepB/Spo0J family partition protein